MPVEKTCKECSIIFKVKPSHAKLRVFCSSECYAKYRSKNLIGRNNPFFGKHHTEEYKMMKRLKYSGVNASCYGRTGDKHPMFGKPNPFAGKKHSQESKLKMSLSHIGKNSGDQNPSYIHGEGSRKYCYQFYGAGGVRIRSLIFYDYKCEECGKTNEQNILEYGRSLAVHHAYYRKMACCTTELDYESGILKVGNILYIKEHDGSIHEHEIIGKPEKFVVLCTSCHGKTTSHNRYKWIKYYENLINTKYDGKSFLTKEEYQNYNQT